MTHAYHEVYALQTDPEDIFLYVADKDMKCTYCARTIEKGTIFRRKRKNSGIACRDCLDFKILNEVQVVKKVEESAYIYLSAGEMYAHKREKVQ